MHLFINLRQLSQHSDCDMEWKPRNFGSISSIGLLKYEAVQVVAVAINQRLPGLVVSMLASGSRVRGFKPGRSRRIFLM
jgi:hypothetical protein